MTQIKVLLVEKINHKYKRLNNSWQASGLSVCLKMIADSVQGVSRVEVDTVEHIRNAIQMFRPEKVLIQSLWIDIESMRSLRTAFPQIRFYYHIHSNLPFLATEGYSFHRIKEAKSLDVGIIFNDARAAYALDATYLPNIYNHPFRQREVGRPDDVIFNVICGGSVRVLKNHVNQAMAAIMFANQVNKKLRFHVNMTRSEGGEEVKQALMGLFSLHTKHELVSIPWMEHKEFVDFCATMDFGMQVSLSETFNIVAADYVAAGIPMIVSRDVYWAHPRFITVDPGDPEKIKNDMAYILLRWGNSSENYRSMEQSNFSSMALWRSFRDS